MASQRVRIGDRVVEVDPSQFDIEVAGEGIYVVSDGSRRWRVAVAGPADERWVFVDGKIERVEMVAPGRARARARGSVHDMASPMPATVVTILAPAGQSVAKGDTVLMLEAMKMELAIRASRDGVIRAIHCKPGELVQPGVPLVEIDS